MFEAEESDWTATDVSKFYYPILGWMDTNGTDKVLITALNLFFFLDFITVSNEFTMVQKARYFYQSYSKYFFWLSNTCNFQSTISTSVGILGRWVLIPACAMDTVPPAAFLKEAIRNFVGFGYICVQLKYDAWNLSRIDFPSLLGLRFFPVSFSKRQTSHEQRQLVLLMTHRGKCERELCDFTIKICYSRLFVRLPFARCKVHSTLRLTD